jgi:hypothetical protein
MRIVQYSPEHFGLLLHAAQRSGSAHSLQHRPFVDYYYTTRDSCRLWLALDGDGAVAAAMGLEQLSFCYEKRQLQVGCASNFVAFRPGAGGYLFLHWMKTSDFACVYGGSADTHRIVRNQRWTYFHGIKTLLLNRRYPARPGEAFWRRTAKSVMRAVVPVVDPQSWPAKLARHAGTHLSVREEHTFTEDLQPADGPFIFRLCPSTEYLNWRYNTSLPFVRYRLFRILAEGVTSGYVILNERPGRVILAHCDGGDPIILASGILLAVAAVTAQGGAVPEVVLTSAHTQMQELFREFGFRAAAAERLFALGARRHSIDLAPDTSRWLINFDWIDNGLRAPFAGQQASDDAHSAITDGTAEYGGDTL